jgi:hypothetical protein
VLILAWVLVALLVAGLWIVLLRRLRSGEATPGGSFGRQFRRKKKNEDWGPTS